MGSVTPPLKSKKIDKILLEKQFNYYFIFNLGKSWAIMVIRVLFLKLPFTNYKLLFLCYNYNIYRLWIINL